ncbi:hypothetical protein D9756_010057 [Leucocoprinus leucothites]|uniref:Uncharacterized protein n=1 Tax=Leucocoprinus leucothites TaxID=201217 RepID=A0A8H5FRW3_9AGAR|nr:hypothetical protein D9756_010057 [Leucoagaricus leucothites]
MLKVILRISARSYKNGHRSLGVVPALLKILIMQISGPLLSLLALSGFTTATILELYNGSTTCGQYPDNTYVETTTIDDMGINVCAPLDTEHVYSIHMEFLAPATSCTFWAYNATTDPDNVCPPNPLANISTVNTRGPCFVYPGFPMTAYKITCEVPDS